MVLKAAPYPKEASSHTYPQLALNSLTWALSAEPGLGMEQHVAGKERRGRPGINRLSKSWRMKV